MALECYLRADGTDRTTEIPLVPYEAYAAGQTAFAAAVAVLPESIWIPGVDRQPLEHDVGGQLATSRGLVLHVQEGNGNPWGWFNRPDVDGSSHWWVSRDGGLVQYVPANRVAWTQRAGNSAWHSVETEGYAREGLTADQIATLAVLYLWGAGRWNWPLQVADRTDGRGLGTHQMGGAAWGGHACPGTIRANQRGQVLALAEGQTPEEDDVMDEAQETRLNERIDGVTDSVMAALTTLVRQAKTDQGTRQLATMRAGSGAEILGVGVLQAMAVRDEVRELRDAVNRLAGEPPAPNVSDVIAAVYETTDVRRLAALGRAVSDRIAQLVPGEDPPA